MQRAFLVDLTKLLGTALEELLRILVSIFNERGFFNFIIFHSLDVSINRSICSSKAFLALDSFHCIES